MNGDGVGDMSGLDSEHMEAALCDGLIGELGDLTRKAGSTRASWARCSGSSSDSGMSSEADASNSSLVGRFREAIEHDVSNDGTLSVDDNTSLADDTDLNADRVGNDDTLSNESNH